MFRRVREWFGSVDDDSWFRWTETTYRINKRIEELENIAEMTYTNGHLKIRVRGKLKTVEINGRKLDVQSDQ